VRTGLATDGNARRSLEDSDEYDIIAATHNPNGLYGYDARAASRSSGKGGKGSSGVNKVAECYDSCLVDSQTPSPTLLPTSAPTRSPHTQPEKPGCCKGGVSFVKVLYQGLPTGNLSLSPENYTLVDACDKANRIEARKHNDDDVVVKFVTCSDCFPDGSGTVKDSCNTSFDTINVTAGDEVCLAAFDKTSGSLSLTSKMPTNLDLYFAENDGSNEATKTTLHTSCSKPIYSPYAVRLDDCATDGYPFYIDVSIIDIGSVIDHPVLIFIDGVGAKFPTSLFTDCDSENNYKDEDNTCCKGGATFLKVRVGGTTVAGSLTTNKTYATDCHYAESSSSSSSKSSGSKSNKGSTVRFVSCEDECLDPFNDVECDEPLDQWEVLTGEDICFGSWDNETNRFDYGSKMVTNLEMFFVPDDTSLFPVQSAYIHTSCSKPVYPNWAAVFAEYCDSSDSSLVNLNETSASSLGFHLAFIDGVSRGYYFAAKELSDETGLSFFDVNFANCGCNCAATAFPTVSPSPTAGGPTGSPPTTSRPRPNPPRPPTASPSNPPTDSGVPPTSPPVSPPTDSPQTDPTASPPTTDTPPTSPPVSPPTETPPSESPPTDSPQSDPTASPPTIDNPPTGPTDSPPNPPTDSPGVPPTFSPPRPNPRPETCEEQCAAWVYRFCNRRGDDGSILPNTPCDVNENLGDGDGEGGRYLRAILNTEDDVRSLSIEEQMKFHDEMAKAYSSLFARLVLVEK